MNPTIGRGANDNSHFHITLRFKVGSLICKDSSPNRLSVPQIRLRTDLILLCVQVKVMVVTGLEALTAKCNMTPCPCCWLKSVAYESSSRKPFKPTMHCDLNSRSNSVARLVHPPSPQADLKSRSSGSSTSQRGRVGMMLVLSEVSG